MSSFLSEQEHHHHSSTCSIKQRTDAMGGIKIQVYGLDSYGYLQYKQAIKEGAMPMELDGVLTVDEWIEFWSSVRNILHKHQRYDCLVGIWVVTGIFVCTALIALHDFRLGLVMALLFAVLLFIALSSCPKNCKTELKDMCRCWSQQRQGILHEGRTTSHHIEARFHHEKGPSTRHGQNSLGVVHFLL